MTEQEAQQAQTVTPRQFHEAMQYVWGALPNEQACQIKDFVDSQAQKIAEQEKELGEARAIADKHRDTVMMYMFGNQPQRDDFPDERRIRNPWENK